jgi:hypothetical protein
MWWKDNVTSVADMRNAYRFLIGKPERRRPLGRTDLHGRKILKQILKKQGKSVWAGLFWLRIGSSGGLW